MYKNKYGLSRTISEAIKRQIRQDDGYGCIVCGNAIYQYEHIDPEFSEARCHDPEAMALLCGSCHFHVTKRIWSKDKIKNAKKDPYCKKEGYSNFNIDLHESEPIIIKLLGTEFVNLNSIIEIDDKVILSIFPPEQPHTPPIISAVFFDRNNNEIASINNNEWIGSSEAFDIKTQGNAFSIRSANRKVDLLIIFEPPNIISIERIHLTYNGVTVSGSSKDGINVQTLTSKLNVPSRETRIENVPYWLSVKGNKIEISNATLYQYQHADGTIEYLPIGFDIDKSTVEILDEPDTTTGQKGFRLKSSGKGGGIGIQFKLPEIKNQPKSNIEHLIEPNELCPCKSDKLYKDCCIDKTKKYIEFLSSKKFHSLSQKIDYICQTKGIQLAFDSKMQVPFKVNESTKPIILFINNTHVTESHFAFSLIHLIKYKEGFATALPQNIYNDVRQKIIFELANKLVNISIIGDMQKMGFDPIQYYTPIYNFYMETLSSLGSERKNKLFLHLNAIAYIQITYEGMYYPHKDQEALKQLFQKKLPLSHMIGEKLIQIIQGNDPYTADGTKNIVYRCLQYLNEEDLIDERSHYLDYLQMMDKEFGII